MRSLHLLAVAASLAVLAQDPLREAGMMRSAQQLAVTTVEHQLLQRLAGDWDVVNTTFPPGGKPQEARGRIVGKSMLGGRYVVLNHSLAVGANRVEAVQLLGFDTLRGHYTSSWRDDVSTWAVECSGAALEGQPQQCRASAKPASSSVAACSTR